MKNLPAFHSLTGCDTTSQFLGFGEKTCWKTYLESYTYLDDMGNNNFDGAMFGRLQKFVIKLYNKHSEATCIDTLRVTMATSTAIGKLPPTSDSLKQHCLRAYLQTLIWLKSLDSIQNLPNITDFGWTIDQTGTISPVLSTLPSLPDEVHMLASCGCTKGMFQI